MNTFGTNGDSPDIQEAIRLIKNDEPLPVDLATRLMESGISPIELIDTYGE